MQQTIIYLDGPHKGPLSELAAVDIVVRGDTGVILKDRYGTAREVMKSCGAAKTLGQVMAEAGA